MNSTQNLANLIQEFDLDYFLTQNKQLDAVSYLLHNKGNTNELKWLLAEQLKVYPKAYRKLPEFVRVRCWFTAKSYEQSSGESSALFKKRLFGGQKLLDLCGGLGVDDWAFCQSFSEVISLDPDETLNILVQHNFKQLKITNYTRFTARAEDYLTHTNLPFFDLVYLDADRRPGENKGFFLHQVQPDFLSIQVRIFEITQKVLLKLSPMADLTYLEEKLAPIEKIMVLGDKQEVKEILVLLNKNYTGLPKREAIVVLDDSTDLVFGNANTNTSEKVSSHEFTYFYEPHPCIIKAGLSQAYAHYCGLTQLAPESTFYSGPVFIHNFMGRTFKQVAAFAFSKTILQKYIKVNNLVSANITKRNFVLGVEEIRKAYKIKEGGSDYLFFTTLSNGEKWVYHGVKP